MKNAWMLVLIAVGGFALAEGAYRVRAADPAPGANTFGTPSDRDLLAKVRTAITRGVNPANEVPLFGTGSVAVTSLRVTVLDGKVTLMGVVDTEAEKAAIGAQAAAVAGADNVINKLVVR